MCSLSQDDNDGVEITAILSVLITNAYLPLEEKI